MEEVLLIALLALSILPALFSFLGKIRPAFIAALLFLVALFALASAQTPGRNMAVFVPMAFVWIALSLVIVGMAGTVGYVRRQVREKQ